MTEERRHIILEAEHGYRRSRAFAILIIAGLILILAVWFLQLKSAFHGAGLSQVAKDLAGFTATVKDNLAAAPSPKPVLSAADEALKPVTTQPVTP